MRLLSVSQNRTDFNELLDINDTFHRELERNQKNDKNHTHVVYKRTIFTFSDCAYIIYDFKDGIEEERKDLRQFFDIALRNTEPLLVEFLKKGFLCRGGIAYGEVYYETERSLFFGPAINRAHLYEEKIAKVPRIIMDKEIAVKVIDLNKERVANAPNIQMAQVTQQMNGDIVLKDEDGQYYLNYLNTCSHGINFFDCLAIYDLWEDLLPSELQKQEYIIADLQEKISQGANENDKEDFQCQIRRCEGIIEKYLWLKKYMDNSCPTEEDMQFWQ